MKTRISALKTIKVYSVLAFILLCTSCSGPFKNDYNDNSPTSGKLKVYYDEGLALHVKNQTATFESHYKNVEIELFESSENEAVQALYTDSCEAIVISRLLTPKEKKAFDSKQYSPKYTAVAKSGIAVIANVNTNITSLSYEQVIEILSHPYAFKDSMGKEQTLTVLFDKNNSAVLHYMMDSVLKEKKLSSSCSILNSSLESINYVAKNKNSIAFVDFAWLSDTDDSVYKANTDKIKFLSVSKAGSTSYELPSQSSFKLETYPFTRTVYVMRKTGEFSLAKGFESFIAGPKGQLTFLKQGLLPARQGERSLHINMEREVDKSQD
ncbi:hypothetical protein CNR22_10280 [Sphingobacteriaceae bacterium]|nr:hypothetical protein CNR22_10280 [Sphingobacteriaceae bacterium]